MVISVYPNPLTRPTNFQYEKGYQYKTNQLFQTSQLFQLRLSLTLEPCVLMAIIVCLNISSYNYKQMKQDILR